MKFLVISDDDVSLLRTMLYKHRDLAIAKIKFYEFLDRNGEYHSSLEGYKKLKLRYDKLLIKLKHEEKTLCGTK